MSVFVRMARPEDAEAARRVADDAFASLRSVYRPAPAALANLSAMSPALERLVAEEDGIVVGTTRFTVLGDCMRVIGLAVAEPRRRRGVARALVDELARIAGDRGCRALALYTITKTGNVPVFERLGFRLVSERADGYAASVDGEPLVEAYMERFVA